MKPATEELLYALLWTLETVACPSLASLNDTFESWAWRHSLLRQIRRLDQRQFLECAGRGPDERLVRITEKGRRVASGGIDPMERWTRVWDGRWRLVVYDVPNKWTTFRIRLARLLRRHRFGRLQKSVWITPDSVPALTRLVQRHRAHAQSLVFFEASPNGGESQAELVGSAWDWEAINRRYGRCLRLLDEEPDLTTANAHSAAAIWLSRERLAWRDACALDPFIPEALLPRGYLGRKAWARRCEYLPRLLRALR